MDGGTGRGLKELSAHYVDRSAPDSQTALKDQFKALGYKFSEGWAKIDRWDPVLVLYAGIDVILTGRLFDVLAPMIPEEQFQLVDFDHRVQALTTRMTQKGFRVDQGYTDQLIIDLEAEEQDARGRAYLLGVENVNSTNQVAEALLARGVTLQERTPSGNYKVDKAVLESLDDDLAKAVLDAKTASKAISSWISPIQAHGRIDGRVHLESRASPPGRPGCRSPIPRFNNYRAEIIESEAVLSLTQGRPWSPATSPRSSSES